MRDCEVDIDQDFLTTNTIFIYIWSELRRRDSMKNNEKWQVFDNIETERKIDILDKNMFFAILFYRIEIKTYENNRKTDI